MNAFPCRLFPVKSPIGNERLYSIKSLHAIFSACSFSKRKHSAIAFHAGNINGPSVMSPSAGATMSRPYVSRSLSPPDHKLVAFYANHHVVPLPPDHRFPMEKYALTVSNLQNDASLSDKFDLRPGPLAEFRDLLLVHDGEYIQRFCDNRMTEQEMRNVGFPWSQELVDRTFSSAGGTIQATRLLFEEGRMMTANIAGGTHHAFRSKLMFSLSPCTFISGERVAIQDYGVQRILVVDLDVHQGNGTAGIFEEEGRVTTFDMFGDKNYPWKTRMRNTHDVPLPDGTEDEEYLSVLKHWLPRLVEENKPQLLIYQAGVDPLKGDRFGRLHLSRSGLLQRNHLLYSTALESSIPTVITMGGGYAEPMLASVECHTDVYRSAAYRLHAWQSSRVKN
ncbi:hypothetical protein CEUSTIGMA_g10618.t1 [Chlamydomonas eustigma]|uniref:Histone deacetylase domain-containing protein n=1 Tax=Chlamydomonas eustigma TaxID=1157962 RepID=A0A250XJU7_9CHLO|nr:hypothetical protein CEUSTIGMA_g10618.t1 [Chlamydomonas eustigma]|eukprot:GAX83192.1 hypothetical protein CEUSTIGMA_g10618.t1 [Chlamydomonas eustigma]